MLQKGKTQYGYGTKTTKTKNKTKTPVQSQNQVQDQDSIFKNKYERDISSKIYLINSSLAFKNNTKNMINIIGYAFSTIDKPKIFDIDLQARYTSKTQQQTLMEDKKIQKIKETTDKIEILRMICSAEYMNKKELGDDNKDLANLKLEKIDEDLADLEVEKIIYGLIRTCYLELKDSKQETTKTKEATINNVIEGLIKDLKLTNEDDKENIKEYINNFPTIKALKEIEKEANLKIFKSKVFSKSADIFSAFEVMPNITGINGTISKTEMEFIAFLLNILDPTSKYKVTTITTNGKKWIIDKENKEQTNNTIKDELFRILSVLRIEVNGTFDDILNGKAEISQKSEKETLQQPKQQQKEEQKQQLKQQQLQTQLNQLLDNLNKINQNGYKKIQTPKTIDTQTVLNKLENKELIANRNKELIAKFNTQNKNINKVENLTFNQNLLNTILEKIDNKKAELNDKISQERELQEKIDEQNNELLKVVKNILMAVEINKIEEASTEQLTIDNVVHNKDTIIELIKQKIESKIDKKIQEQLNIIFNQLNSNINLPEEIKKQLNDAVNINGRIDILFNTIIKQNNEINSLKKEIEQWASIAEDFADDVNKIASQVIGRDTEPKTHNEDVQKVVDTIKQLQQDNENLNEQLQNKEQEINNLKEKEKQNKQKIEEIQAKLKEASQAESNKLKELIKVINDKETGIKDKINSINNELTKLQNENIETLIKIAEKLAGNNNSELTEIKKQKDLKKQKEEVINFINKEIENLITEKDRLQKENKDLESKITDLSNKIVELNTQIDTLKSQNNEQKQTIQKQGNTIKEQEKQLQEAQKQQDDIIKAVFGEENKDGKTLNDAKEKINTLNSDLQKIFTQLDVDDTNAAIEKIEELRAKGQNLDKIFKALGAEDFDKAIARINELKAKEKDLQKIFEKLGTNNIENAITKIEGLEKTIKDLEKENEKLKNGIREIAKKVGIDLNKDQDINDTVVNDIAKKMQDKDNQIKQTTEQLQQLQLSTKSNTQQLTTQNTKLSEELKQLQIKYNNLNKDFSNQQQQINNLTQEKQQNEQKIRDIQAQLGQALNIEKNRLQQFIDNNKAFVNFRINEVNELLNNLQNKNKEELKKIAEDLRIDSNKLQGQNEQGIIGLISKQTEDLLNKQKTLQEQKNTLQEKLEKAEVQKGKLLKEIQELKKEVENIKQLLLNGKAQFSKNLEKTNIIGVLLKDIQQKYNTQLQKTQELLNEAQNRRREFVKRLFGQNVNVDDIDNVQINNKLTELQQQGQQQRLLELTKKLGIQNANENDVSNDIVNYFNNLREEITNKNNEIAILNQIVNDQLETIKNKDNEIEVLKAQTEKLQQQNDKLEQQFNAVIKMLENKQNKFVKYKTFNALRRAVVEEKTKELNEQLQNQRQDITRKSDEIARLNQMVDNQSEAINNQVDQIANLQQQLKDQQQQINNLTQEKQQNEQKIRDIQAQLEQALNIEKNRLQQFIDNNKAFVNFRINEVNELLNNLRNKNKEELKKIAEDLRINSNQLQGQNEQGIIGLISKQTEDLLNNQEKLQEQNNNLTQQLQTVNKEKEEIQRQLQQNINKVDGYTQTEDNDQEVQTIVVNRPTTPVRQRKIQDISAKKVLNKENKQEDIQNGKKTENVQILMAKKVQQTVQKNNIIENKQKNTQYDNEPKVQDIKATDFTKETLKKQTRIQDKRNDLLLSGVNESRIDNDNNQIHESKFFMSLSYKNDDRKDIIEYSNITPNGSFVCESSNGIDSTITKTLVNTSGVTSTKIKKSFDDFVKEDFCNELKNIHTTNNIFDDKKETNEIVEEFKDRIHDENSNVNSGTFIGVTYDDEKKPTISMVKFMGEDKEKNKKTDNLYLDITLSNKKTLRIRSVGKNDNLSYINFTNDRYNDILDKIRNEKDNDAFIITCFDTDNDDVETILEYKDYIPGSTTQTVSSLFNLPDIVRIQMKEQENVIKDEQDQKSTTKYQDNLKQQQIEGSNTPENSINKQY